MYFNHTFSISIISLKHILKYFTKLDDKWRSLDNLQVLLNKKKQTLPYVITIWIVSKIKLIMIKIVLWHSHSVSIYWRYDYFFFIFLVQIMKQSHAANNNTYTQSKKDPKKWFAGVHWWCLNKKEQNVLYHLQLLHICLYSGKYIGNRNKTDQTN